LTKTPWDNGLVIFRIEGLGPPNAAISMTDHVTSNGAVSEFARIGVRNITISIKPTEAPTIEITRQRIYKYFQIAKPVTLEIDTDTRKVYATGEVESVDATIFHSQTTVIISILCADPLLYSQTISQSTFFGVEPRFEFPFSNESLEEKLIEFGDIQITTRSDAYYEGDVDIGFDISMQAFGRVENVAIYNANSLEKMAINTDRIRQMTGRELNAGDQILISTTRGNRHITLLRDGHRINIISAIERRANWFQLTPGHNVFAFTADVGQHELIMILSFKNAFGGI